MANEDNKDIEISLDELEEAEDEMDDDDEDAKEEAFEKNLELQEDYSAPEMEEKHNANLIINKALERPDTVRTTFLTESELGRPIFSVRFMSDLHDDALRLGLDRIANYYYEKIQNVTSSGMSYKGFMMNLNVTQNKDQVRRRMREVPNTKEVKK